MYDVRVVEDAALPADHEWALMEHGGHYTFVVKQSAQGPQVMADAWAAYRLLERHRQDRTERRTALHAAV